MNDLDYLDHPYVVRIDRQRPNYGWRKDGYTKRAGGAMEWRILCLPLARSWLRVYAVCVSNVTSYFVKAGGKRYWLRDGDLGKAIEQARSDAEIKAKIEKARRDYHLNSGT